MTIRTGICDLFEIERPIFGFAHSVAVTAAISRAGGLGVCGATMDEPEEIAAKAKELRALCGARPFGLDLPSSVAALEAKYAAAPPKEKGFHGRNVCSQTLFRRQVEAALASGADVFAAAEAFLRR